MSKLKIGDRLVRKPDSDGACVEQAVVVQLADQEGWVTYEVTEVRGDRSGYEVGERRTIHHNDISHFYTVTPAPIAQEATMSKMFTTTITKTVPKTLDVAVGDVFDWSNGKELYYVTAVDPSAAEGEQITATFRAHRDGERYTETFNLRHFDACTHLRPEGAEATTVDVEEVVGEIEHKFQVGDVLRIDSSCGRPYTRTIHAIEPQRGHSYRYESGGWDTIEFVDSRGTLIGGPRFVEPAPETKFQVGDIVDTRVLGKGRKITAIEKRYGEWRYVLDGAVRGDSVAGVDTKQSFYGYVLVGGPRFEAKLTALQALQTARDLIALPEKWIKGAYKSDGRFCAIGAIQEATKTVSGARSEAVRMLGKTIKPETNDPEGAIINFNDDYKRTHEQVLAAFDKAIADLRFAEAVAS
jgi:hypothetical protein